MDAPLGDGDGLSSHDENAAAPRPTLLRASPGYGATGTPCNSAWIPARAVLLEVANPGAARLLDLLDGAHSERAILDHATKIYTMPTLIAAVGYAAGEILTFLEAGDGGRRRGGRLAGRIRRRA